MTWFTKKNLWQQDITKVEYLIGLLQGVVGILLITYLFYHSIWAAVPFLLLLFPYMRWWEIQQELQKKSEFQIQFKDYLQALMAALRTGYAVENGMIEARKDLEGQYAKDTRIMKDIIMMERLLGMNIPIEQVWKEWATQLEVESLRRFTTVFMIAKKAGGDSVAIIQKSITNICDTVEVEMEIQVALSAKKMEFQIMSMVPLGIIFYMKLCFRDFMSVLYGNVFGIIIMSILLGVYALAYIWGSHMLQIEV